MKEIIKKMAHLARLSFPDSELARYTAKVTTVLDYVKQLSELKTDSVEPTSHAVEVKGELRSDIIIEPTLAQEIVCLAPNRDQMFYKVPKVIEE